MPVAQGFPINNQPVVDPKTGQVTQSWRQFFVSLWNRTGSSMGANAFVPGDIKPSGGSGAQDGWLECDGSAISRAAFAGLFAAIGTTWGPGDGFSTFNLPDLRDRTLVGVSGAKPLADLGGAASVNLATNQLPAHNHPVVDPGHTHPFTADPHLHTINDPGHEHIAPVVANTNTAGAAAGSATAGVTSVSTTNITINNAVVTGTTDAEPTGITTGDTGAGVAVPTQSPYAAVTYLIKT